MFLISHIIISWLILFVFYSYCEILTTYLKKKGHVYCTNDSSSSILDIYQWCKIYFSVVKLIIMAIGDMTCTYRASYYHQSFSLVKLNGKSQQRVHLLMIEVNRKRKCIMHSQNLFRIKLINKTIQRLNKHQQHFFSFSFSFHMIDWLPWVCNFFKGMSEYASMKKVNVSDDRKMNKLSDEKIWRRR